MVSPPCDQRIRAAVRPPGRVSIRVEPDQFVDSVNRGWPDIAVLDPTLARGVGSIPAALRVARIPTLLYVQLTPLYARATVDMLRFLPALVVTIGYGDDANALAAAIQQRGRAQRGAMLLDRLAPQLERLPTRVARGIAAANESLTRLSSATDLACYCGVHRGTLARMFAEVQLAAPGYLVAALGLLHQYPLLCDPNIPSDRAARLVGLSSRRGLNRRCMSLTGHSLEVLRAGMRVEELCEACAAHLTSATCRRSSAERAQARAAAPSG